MNGLLRLIIVHIIGVAIICVWVIYHIVKKKVLFPTITDAGKEDIVAKTLVLAVLVFIVVMNIIPECRDLPYYYNNEFCYVEGVAQNHSDKSGRGPHTVYIKDEESGEEIYVSFSYDGTINQGDYLKVKYLPNTKDAILLEINGRKQVRGGV